MHVAICLFYNSPMGGLHLNVLDSCTQLRAAGHRVTVFCPGGPLGVLLQDLGCTVLPLGAVPPDADRFDLVHAHPGAIKPAARLAHDRDLPLFVTYHGRWLQMIQTITPECAHVFGVSDAICDALRAAVPAARKRISLMPNGISPLPAPDSPPPPADAPLGILVASRFASDKQAVTEMLLDLWYLQDRRGITGLHWHIAGDGEGIDRLQAFCAAFPGIAPGVTFHGWLDSAATQNLIRSCDVSLGPGRSALEAMNLARPVIPLGSGGCQGLVTADRFGDCAHSNFGGAFSDQHRDAASVLDALTGLRDGDRGRALGLQLQSLVRQNFDLASHHARLMKFYVKAVRDRRAQLG